MEPTISVKNVRLTERLEEYVTKKTSRLERFMPNLAEVHVDLSKQNSKSSRERNIAQLTVRDSKGTILRAEEDNEDVFAAVDIVVDKMYRQIKRYRGKRLKSRRNGDITDVVLEPLPLDDEPEPITDYKVVRQKRFAMLPMSADEAVDQMELLGHDFYMFFNIEEEAVNVVYRRHNQDYGLLQPEMS